MNIETAKILFDLLKDMYKRDRANVYTLPHDCDFLISANVPAYDGKYWRFAPAAGLPGTTHARLKAYHLQANGESVCDGVTGYRDTDAGVKGASLHDPGYLELFAIAESWKNEPYAPGPMLQRDWVSRRGSKGSPCWTEADVQQLFDAIFGDAMEEAAQYPLITRVYYSAVRLFGGPFLSSVRRLPKAASLLLVAMLTGCSGCFNLTDIAQWPNGLPEPEKTGGYTNSAIESVAGAISEVLAQVEADEEEKDTSDEKDETVEAGTDQAAFAALKWVYGGFNGAGAKLDQPRISKLTVQGGGIAYRWDVDLKVWGLGYEDPGAVAALFCLVDGEWRGGKFEWVSSSRSTRGFSNINGGYHGWRRGDLATASKIAFVVVSEDGKKRSNVIVAGGL